MVPRCRHSYAAVLSLILAAPLIVGVVVESFAPNHPALSPHRRRSAFTSSTSTTSLAYSLGVGPTNTGARRVTSVEGPEHLADFLSRDDRLCIVKVYAHWCKTCKVFDVRYRKLASREGDRVDAGGNVVQRGRVRFGEVEFHANEELCRGLGIETLPHIIVYRGGAAGANDYITRFQCGPSSFQRVIDAVEDHAGGDGADECRTPECEFERTMAAGSALGDEIMRELQAEARVNANANANGKVSSRTITPFEEFIYSQSSMAKNSP